jgi:hypothetical protein
VDTWNEKTLRLFAADCAEHVLGIYEKQYPKDDRPRKAIQAARDFANGLIDAAAYADYAANAAAAAAAAYADYNAYAADYAANAASAASAACAAAYATYADYAAAYADYAANVAAYAANVAADYNAETQWQVNRLKYYLEVE